MQPGVLLGHGHPALQAAAQVHRVLRLEGQDLLAEHLGYVAQHPGEGLHQFEENHFIVHAGILAALLGSY